MSKGTAAASLTTAMFLSPSSFSLSFFVVLLVLFRADPSTHFLSLFRLHFLDQTKKKRRRAKLKGEKRKNKRGQEKATLLAILPPIKRDRDYRNTTGHCCGRRL
jgi:hypothetical protein